MFDPFAAIQTITALCFMVTTIIGFVRACFKLSDDLRQRRQLGR